MTHQTPISSSSPLVSFNSPTTTTTNTTTSSSSLLCCPLQSRSHFDSTQGRRMEALKSSLRWEPSAPSGQQHHQGLLADDQPWAALERGNILGDGFSVDDLLDLGGFAEPEKETEEKPETAAGSTEADENSNSLLSSSSALSFQPRPPSDISLPMSPLPLMAHDVEELEWVSLIIDDSLSEFPPSCSDVVLPFPPPLPKPQAVSPPENLPAPLLSPTVCALSTEALVPVKAKRSKRSRSAGAGWSLSGLPPFTNSSASSSSTTTTTTSSSSSCCSSSSSFDSYLIYDPTGAGVYNLLDGNPLPLPPLPSKKQKTKKRGRKPKPPQAASAASGGGGERRCSHCGVQKTPQWRAGPLGAKTLCNACGVRYKSGRLLPEYRPACSPTFVTDVHSNSHRKVLEMRRKKEAELVAAAAPPVPSF
ncbi:GATA transcription factor 7 [Elaeis guineensis]|uniref:GATA transcription factor 5 n=1 Tax=Elaeis guineensis var. tenera TaxID=51953 RepID=A0A6I9RY23_ELAGV|nr:GATA transcription factor 5 [Elaeis guineensis]